MIKNKIVQISANIQQRLLCPITKSKLTINGDSLISSSDPSLFYPIINGIPILINNAESLFSIDDFTKFVDTTWELKPNKIKEFIRSLAPGIGLNIKAKKNYQKLCSMLPTDAKILIVGGSIKGEGTDVIYSNDSFEIIGMDVSFGPYTKIIADGHDIPFEEETFDCVIVQAVLEHVLDPQRCVGEIHRVLKSSGIVYAETPFMQQVHMKQYDFTRFTHLGHRRLFRYFEEIEHAPLMGPGTVLAWSYAHFIKSFTSSNKIAFFLTIFIQLTAFFWKYFDYYLLDKPGSYGAASAFFFIGKKNTVPLPDKELIKSFKGMK